MGLVFPVVLTYAFWWTISWNTDRARDRALRQLRQQGFQCEDRHTFLEWYVREVPVRSAVCQLLLAGLTAVSFVVTLRVGRLLDAEFADQAS